MVRLSRKTIQKESIQKEIEKTNSFFTAETLHKNIHKKEPTIGIATIYRYLKEQQKKGTLHTYTCKRKTIYSKSEKSHSHYTCEKCGKTTHIHITNLDFLENTLKGSVCHFQIDITGTCNRCKQKN